MEQLIQDVQNNLLGYYDNIVILLPKLLAALIVFSFIYFVAGKIRKAIQTRLVKQMDDPLLARFLARVVRLVLLSIAVLMVLQIIGLGKAAGGLLAGAGVGAFVIGFAFKDIGENLLSGIVLAFNRPFRVGDVVELSGAKGKVIGLSLRNTHLKTFDGKDIYIPNANIIKNNVINYTIDGFLRYQFQFDLDNGSDIPKAQALILEVLNDIEGILQIEGRKPSVTLSSLGTHTMNVTAFYWLDTFDKTISGGVIQTLVLQRIPKVLEDAGFYLPGNVTELKNFKEGSLAVAG
ncbi:MAG: mechanosensitive ion channel domain-containing protein [Bacteroidota bacterium]